jgi:hypothetical protein
LNKLTVAVINDHLGVVKLRTPKMLNYVCVLYVSSTDCLMLNMVSLLEGIINHTHICTTPVGI